MLAKDSGCHTGDTYESEELLNQYLLFHYGQPEEILPYDFGPAKALGFPLRTVTECIDLAMLPPRARALDIGCGVGRSSFELARYCAEVVGIDTSTAFIRAAEKLRTNGRLRYTKKVLGSVSERPLAVIDGDIDRNRVRFQVGDAHEVPRSLGKFEVVHAANLLCRMTDPRKLLERLPALIASGGQLVLTTPLSWLEDYTPRSNWLENATLESGGALESLQASLADNFRLLRWRDMPFLIREHARKFQWGVALATMWVRQVN